MNKALLALLICFASFEAATAQYGILDATFGNGGLPGIDTFSNPANSGFEKAIAFQADSKILVSSGGSVKGLGRLNTNGAIDNTFGNGGWVNVGLFTIEDIVLQSDGKILAVGRPVNITYGDTYVWRYQTNGDLDSSFGFNGRAGDTTLGTGYEQAGIQPGGKIVWSASYGVKRLNTDGSLDTSFGSAGFFRFSHLPFFAASMAVDPATGDMVFGGYTSGAINVAAIRVLANGSLDNSFGAGGMDSIGVGFYGLAPTMKVALNSTGQIVLAGDYTGSGNNNHVVCLRMDANGTLDNAFGSGGIVYPTWNVSHGYEFFGGMTIESDDKIFLACTSLDSSMLANSGDIAITRLNTDGSSDAAFGVPRLDINHNYETSEAIGVGPDGKLIVNGNSDSLTVVARYTTGVSSGIGALKEVLLPTVYPNPFDNTISVTLQTENAKEASVTVLNTMGQAVFVDQENNLNGTFTKTVDLNALSDGVYFLQVTTDAARAVRKIVKQ